MVKKPKMGRPTHTEQSERDKQLIELYHLGKDTPTSASQKVGCHRDYASKVFNIEGAKLIDLEEQDWVKRSSLVRVQAIEGFTNRIKDAETHIKVMLDKRSEALEIHSLLKPDTIKQLKNHPIALAVKEFDEEEFKTLLQILKSYLSSYVNIGFLVESFNKELRNERILETELQMQLDDLKLTVPPSEIMEALMERYIASKNNLQPALPQQEKEK